MYLHVIEQFEIYSCGYVIPNTFENELSSKLIHTYLCMYYILFRTLQFAYGIAAGSSHLSCLVVICFRRFWSSLATVELPRAQSTP
jgi:hypothetical protein